MKPLLTLILAALILISCQEQLEEPTYELEQVGDGEFCGTIIPPDWDSQEKMIQLDEGKALVNWNIPVVFHILSTNTSQNIQSDAQVYSAMRSINDAYANEGVWNTSDGVDTKVRFTLVDIIYYNGEEIWGEPFRTGGVRFNGSGGVHVNTVKSYVEAQSGYGGTEYYHVICPHTISSTSSGVLGFAQLGMSGFVTHVTRQDKIQDVRYLTHVGLTGNAATFHHEGGHTGACWHTFGNDCLTTSFGDGCADTPPENGPNWSCVNLSCGTHVPKNHMSYGTCRDRFTECQAGRMQSTLSAFKPQWQGTYTGQDFPFTIGKLDLGFPTKPARWFYYGDVEQVTMHTTLGGVTDTILPITVYSTDITNGLQENGCSFVNCNVNCCFFQHHPVITQGARNTFVSYVQNGQLKLWPVMWRYRYVNGELKVTEHSSAPVRRLYEQNQLNSINYPFE